MWHLEQTGSSCPNPCDWRPRDTTAVCIACLDVNDILSDESWRRRFFCSVGRILASAYALQNPLVGMGNATSGGETLGGNHLGSICTPKSTIRKATVCRQCLGSSWLFETSTPKRVERRLALSFRRLILDWTPYFTAESVPLSCNVSKS